jgi:hypothetical protein
VFGLRLYAFNNNRTFPERAGSVTITGTYGRLFQAGIFLQVVGYIYVSEVGEVFMSKEGFYQLNSCRKADGDE